MTEIENNNITETTKEYGRKKHNTVIPILLVFVFMAVMVVYTSRLLYSVAVSLIFPRWSRTI